MCQANRKELGGKAGKTEVLCYYGRIWSLPTPAQEAGFGGGVWDLGGPCAGSGKDGGPEGHTVPPLNCASVRFACELVLSQEGY